MLQFLLSPTWLPNHSGNAKVDTLIHQWKGTQPSHCTARSMNRTRTRGSLFMVSDFLSVWLAFSHCRLEHTGMFRGLHISDKWEECRGFDCKLPLCSANHMWFLAPFSLLWPKRLASAHVQVSAPNHPREEKACRPHLHSATGPTRW